MRVRVTSGRRFRLVSVRKLPGMTDAGACVRRRRSQLNAGGDDDERVMNFSSLRGALEMPGCL